MPTPDLTNAIVHAYLVDRKSMGEIAKLLNLTRWTVTKILTEARVEIRDPKSAAHLAKPKHVVDPSHRPALLELTDGLMLGDGNITKTGELALGQTVVRAGWIHQVASMLETFDVEYRVATRKSVQKKPPTIDDRVIHSGDRIDLRTKTYAFFYEQRQRWYPEGVKIVPRDLVLTPVSVAQWFAGDGSPWSNGGLCFCTQCFTKDECNFLRGSLLTHLGVASNLINANMKRRDQFVVHVGQRNEAVKLRDAIAKHMPECCLYKFDKVRERKTSAIDWDSIADLGYVRDDEVAKRLNVPVSTVTYNRTVRNIMSSRDRGRTTPWENSASIRTPTMTINVLGKSRRRAA